MRILLCAATEMEIAPTIQALSLKDGHEVHLLITGVGLMACTYALTKEVATHRPGLILQAGVAGSLHPEWPLSEVVVVRTECVGDLGVDAGNVFQSLFDLKLLGANTPPWMEGRLVNEADLLQTLNLPQAAGVSVNEITTSEQKINHYRHQLKVQVESMEGAALHYVALMEKIPFLQIRALSNFIGERDKSKWELKKAIANLNHHLQRILMNLEAI